jgi:hypothetical protein
MNRQTANRKTTPEAPIITPEILFENRGVNIREYQFGTALVAFMPIGHMADKFGGRLMDSRIFPMVKKSWGKGHAPGRVILVGRYSAAPSVPPPSKSYQLWALNTP